MKYPLDFYGNIWYNNTVKIYRMGEKNYENKNNLRHRLRFIPRID